MSVDELFHHTSGDGGLGVVGGECTDMDCGMSFGFVEEVYWCYVGTCSQHIEGCSSESSHYEPGCLTLNRAKTFCGRNGA